ncbi:MAG: N-acetylneuraminate synthase family protein [Planctomycetota bacterium]|jgi:sialic acid synthase SpsE
MKRIKIGDRWVGDGEPVYIIAEIASSFDGSKKRAKLLIDLAVNCGADAVKFQCFKADKIISKEAFEGLKSGFQSKWDKSVYQMYQDAEFTRQWYQELFDYANSKGVDFLSSPYDKEAVDIVAELGSPALKVGSGDLTWLEILTYMAEKKLPIILGTGASTIAEIEEAVETIRNAGNDEIILLQCVTNYPSHFEHANIKAMQTLQKVFGLPVGYSDHTPGSVVPLGAVALGACMIEKHFTDDRNRKGPDHAFSMNPKDFKEMVDGIRALEKALGSCAKNLYKEEEDTVVLQRRCLRAAKDLAKGTIITEEMVEALRPAPKEAMYPKYKPIIIGRVLKADMKKGSPFTWEMI